MIMLNIEWNVLIGAFIALFSLLSGYFVNHVLRLREERLLRAFEIRKEGRNFYLPLYGFLAGLSDLAIGYVRAIEQGKAQVFIEQGFPYLMPEEIVSIFKAEFKEFLKFICEAKRKGYEVCLLYTSDAADE